MKLLIVIYSQEILPDFRYGIDGPTHWWMSFPRFPPVDAFKLSSYICRTLTAQKVYLTYRFKNIVRLLLTEQC